MEKTCILDFDPFEVRMRDFRNPPYTPVFWNACRGGGDKGTQELVLSLSTKILSNHTNFYIFHRKRGMKSINYTHGKGVKIYELLEINSPDGIKQIWTRSQNKFS